MTKSRGRPRFVADLASFDISCLQTALDVLNVPVVTVQSVVRRTRIANKLSVAEVHLKCSDGGKRWGEKVIRGWEENKQLRPIDLHRISEAYGGHWLDYLLVAAGHPICTRDRTLEVLKAAAFRASPTVIRNFWHKKLNAPEPNRQKQVMNAMRAEIIRQLDISFKCHKTSQKTTTQQ
jgi:hypothetical protein